MEAPSAARGEAAWALATFVVLTVAVVALYGRTLTAPFIFDDRTAIVENPSLRRLWPLIGTDAARGPLNPPPLAPTARRPLPNLTFALNYRLGGLDPAGYRVVNICLHLLTAVMLAAVVRGTLRLPYFAPAVRSAAEPVALAVALLWAVHPLATEAVVYVTQRTELLAALCYLTTLWAAQGHWGARATAGRRGWLLVAGVVSAAGMASKEVVASVPLAVLLYERTFLVDSWSAVRRSWPLHLTLALGWILLVALSVGGIGGLADARHSIPVHVWWLTQTKMAFLYLRLALWPWPLAIHYAPNFLWSVGAAWPWLVLFAIGTAAALVAIWHRPAARFVVVALVMVLAPTLVIPLPKMIAAERRMYLPLAGLIAIVVVGAWRWIGDGRSRAAVAAVVVGTLVVVLASVSAARLRAYATVETIWREAIAQQPDDPMAHYNLGVALLDAGRPPAEALPSFEQALRLDPDYPAALDNLGLTLNRLGRSEEALGHLERALALAPDDVVAHNNLGIALTQIGRPAEALAHLNRALELDPEAPKAKVHLNLGNALLALGRTDEALDHFERAVGLAPDDADAQYNLGAVLMRVGRFPEAIASFEHALRLAPDDAETQNNLASALLRDGQAERAIEIYRRALAAHPDNANLHNNFGTALLVSGRRDDAMVQLTEALRLNPDHVNARRNLGSALLDAGRPREAAVHLDYALRLDPSDAQARFKCAVAYGQIDRGGEAVTLATEALTQARAQGQTALADDIATWLRSH